MSASMIHFGVDFTTRIPVLQSAGFQVDVCSSIESLIETLQWGEVDGVVVPEKPGVDTASLITVTRSCPATSVILFAEGPDPLYEADFDLVIPALTPPHVWLADIRKLLARSKALQAESNSLHAQASHSKANLAPPDSGPRKNASAGES